MKYVTTTVERLRELFICDAETGTLIHRTKVRKAKLGGIAGRVRSSGYWRVTVDGQSMFLHRVIWAMVMGRWPVNHIDHINGDPSDNRIANLRDVPQVINTQNQRTPHGKTASGFLGVSRLRKKWRSEIKVNGARYHLGVRNTPEEAFALYVAAKRRLHEGNTL